ncbi:MAG: hypothetical protein AB7S69_08770 [Salinivirgaceae bacterium]
MKNAYVNSAVTINGPLDTDTGVADTTIQPVSDSGYQSCCPYPGTKKTQQNINLGFTPYLRFYLSGSFQKPTIAKAKNHPV